MNKYVKDGQVAVIVSADYGSGWSTWAKDEQDRLQRLFDPAVVDYLLTGKFLELGQYITLRYPDSINRDPSTLTINWLPEGTEFYVVDYDGLENIKIKDNIPWITA